MGGAITIQMRRIEGRYSPLAWIQLATGALLVLEFIYLIFFWQVATFRSWDVHTTQLLNDMAWIPFVGLSSTLILQTASYGVAILMDKRKPPIFPRWVGYYNLFAAMMFTPGSFNVFFNHGVLAWNGLGAFYLPVAVWATFVTLNSIFLRKAVDHQVEEEEREALHSREALTGVENGGEGPAPTAADIASLRVELDRLRARVG